MSKAHAFIIAIALGVAAVAGTFAALGTVSGGAQAAGSSVSADLSVREAQLNRAEARLARLATKRPPALPPLPSGGAVSQQRSAGSGSPAVVDDYGEDEHEFEDEHEDEDEHAAESESSDDHGDDD